MGNRTLPQQNHLPGPGHVHTTAFVLCPRQKGFLFRAGAVRVHPLHKKPFPLAENKTFRGVNTPQRENPTENHVFGEVIPINHPKEDLHETGCSRPVIRGAWQGFAVVRGSRRFAGGAAAIRTSSRSRLSWHPVRPGGSLPRDRSFRPLPQQVLGIYQTC